MTEKLELEEKRELKASMNKIKKLQFVYQDNTGSIISTASHETRVSSNKSIKAELINDYYQFNIKIGIR